MIAEAPPGDDDDDDGDGDGGGGAAAAGGAAAPAAGDDTERLAEAFSLTRSLVGEVHAPLVLGDVLGAPGKGVSCSLHGAAEAELTPAELEQIEGEVGRGLSRSPHHVWSTQQKPHKFRTRPDDRKNQPSNVRKTGALGNARLL